MENFQNRHIGVQSQQIDEMLSVIGVDNMEKLLYNSVPDNIRDNNDLKLPLPLTEYEYLSQIKGIALRTKSLKIL